MSNTLRSHTEGHYTEGNSDIDQLASQYNFASYADRLHFLHTVLVSGFGNISYQRYLYLYAGCKVFGAALGWIAQPAAEGFIYQCFGGDDDLRAQIKAGAFTKIDENVIESGKTIALNDCHVQADDSIICQSQPVAAFDYVGTPLADFPGGVAVLAFISPSQGAGFSLIDHETIELMADGVAKMTELQNKQQDVKHHRADIFATPGIKSFEEYVAQAALPETYGIPGRVVDVLKRRIGKSSLAIDYIAEELNLSKRTLQRRLQQQSLNFAQLRDQVRYHYSIGYLVEESLSIDSISAALDFSDRTSFTNAFKRWTGLSPSTFRKLFRDYT
jgi:AraC-like DNA-binding protein